MRNSTILLLVTILFSFGCNNPQKPETTSNTDSLKMKQDADNLNNILKKVDVPSQIFSAPGDQLSLVKGKKGTVIFLNPSDLETEDGQAPGKQVIVELKELTSGAELARADAQTMSNGNLLASGGAYYINMTSGGKQLKLKKDKDMKVAFPKFTDSSMSVFYGQRDSAGQMNWQPANQQFTSKNGYSVNIGDTMDNRSIMVYNSKNYKLMGYVGNDSTYKRDTASLHSMKAKEIQARKEAWVKNDMIKDAQNSSSEAISTEKLKEILETSEKLNKSLYDITSIKQLGWINCDRFSRVEQKTNITYTIDPKDSISTARIYLVYKDINAVTSYNYYNINNSNTRYFEGTPVGYKARLIAVTSRNNELLTCKMDMTIADNQHTLIVWKKTTPEELNSYFDANNNWGQ